MRVSQTGRRLCWWMILSTSVHYPPAPSTWAFNLWILFQTSFSQVSSIYRACRPFVGAADDRQCHRALSTLVRTQSRLATSIDMRVSSPGSSLHDWFLSHPETAKFDRAPVYFDLLLPLHLWLASFRVPASPYIHLLRWRCWRLCQQGSSGKFGLGCYSCMVSSHLFADRQRIGRLWLFTSSSLSLLARFFGPVHILMPCFIYLNFGSLHGWLGKRWLRERLRREGNDFKLVESSRGNLEEVFVYSCLKLFDTSHIVHTCTHAYGVHGVSDFVLLVVCSRTMSPLRFRSTARSRSSAVGWTGIATSFGSTKSLTEVIATRCFSTPLAMGTVRP